VASIDTFNPNPPQIQDLQDIISPFLQQFFQDPSQNPFGNALTGQATNAISGFLGNNPEQQVFNQLQEGLLGIFGGPGGQSFGEAAQTISQRNLQQSLGQLSNQAPGRFSTAFTGQGIGLAQVAQQDLNLLMQEFNARDIQNRIGAGDLLGTLAGQAGEGAFGRAERAGQFGLDQQNQLLQLVLGGLRFAQPTPLDTVINDGFRERLGGGLSGAAKGAAIGSVVPGIGTGIGALGGGLIGLFS